MEVIQNIYTYVTKNITYDEQKATEVVDGYLPVVDETLSSGTGICFDYAALMASMMRTQRIPTSWKSVIQAKSNMLGLVRMLMK